MALAISFHYFKIYPYFKAENVPLFRKNLVQAFCDSVASWIVCLSSSMLSKRSLNIKKAFDIFHKKSHEERLGKKIMHTCFFTGVLRNTYCELECIAIAQTHFYQNILDLMAN
jgi:hypothetical protein